MICRDFGDDIVIPALCRAINRHINEVSEKENTIGGTCYWKIHEVCQYTLGITRDLVILSCQNGKLDFDLRNYLAHWQYLPPVLPILLTGRCTWFAAKYSSILPSQMYNNYIEVVLNHLRSDSVILKVCAVRYVQLNLKEKSVSLHTVNHFSLWDCFRAGIYLIFFDYIFDSFKQIIFLQCCCGSHVYMNFIHKYSMLEKFCTILRGYIKWNKIHLFHLEILIWVRIIIKIKNINKC